MAVAQIDQILQGLDKYSPSTRNTPYKISSPVRSNTAAQDVPLLLKEFDINKKTGTLTSYLTVYKNSDGSDYIDAYGDIVAAGSFSKSIAELDAARKRTNNPWLCPTLWQHDRYEPIGGVKGITEDSRGVVYESYLAMEVQRAREALDLAEHKMVASSYGYDVGLSQILPGNLRKLLEIKLREASLVTFPANDLAQVIGTKGRRRTSVHLPVGEVDAAPLVAAINGLARDMKAARNADHFDPEYEDYLWRLRRAEAYRCNPAAFQEHSKHGWY